MIRRGDADSAEWVAGSTRKPEAHLHSVSTCPPAIAQPLGEHPTRKLLRHHARISSTLVSPALALYRFPSLLSYNFPQASIPPNLRYSADSARNKMKLR
jgi:hypothetical protein